jgi:cell division protease FtsH
MSKKFFIKEKSKKLKKLEKVSEELKSEFIGIDDAIDKIFQSIKPWYVAPELLTKPVVVSLWGMTGTGKTSVIKRIIEKLDYTSRSSIIDCGKFSSDSKFNDDSIDDILSKGICDGNSYSSGVSQLKEMTSNMLIALDEFQLIRTIDENGAEIDRPDFRQVWELLDTGVVECCTKNGWEFQNFYNRLADLKEVASKIKGEYKLSCSEGFLDLIITKNQRDDLIKATDGTIYWLNNIDSTDDPELDAILSETTNSISISSAKGNKKKKGKDANIFTVPVLDITSISIIKNKLKNSYPEEEASEILKDFRESTSLTEVCDKLEKIRDKIAKPEVVNCSKSLIFVIGNLDEAFFKYAGENNPDLDADSVFELTNKVTVTDIKDALTYRFRPEQIARLGNNMIKYPTLNENSFRKIIDKEIERLQKQAKDSFNIKFEVADQIKQLIYSEGVFPIQGVRPVLSTSEGLLNPLISESIINLNVNSKGVLKFKVKDDCDNFRQEEITIEAVYTVDSSVKTMEKTISLALGTKRDVNKRKTIPILSVHEAGHAIVFSYLTGKLPSNIVSLSVNGGGFCSVYDESREDVPNRKDILNDVKISMAGYLAEFLIFKDSELVLCGSSSDINSAYYILRSHVYKGGFIGISDIENPVNSTSFIPFSNTNVENDFFGIPSGIDDTVARTYISGLWNKLEDETRNILANNKKLLSKLAIYLSKNGSMNGSKMKEIIEEVYGDSEDPNVLSISTLKQAEKQNSYEHYIDILKSNLTD